MLRPEPDVQTWADASPTKNLFVNLLVKDIALQAAVLDLVDNSIDAARRLRKADPEHETHIDVFLSEHEFSIQDNCGGFSTNRAESYVFRFGRDEDAEFANDSIGRFGVGMKRALLKMGGYFTVTSQHGKDSFVVTVNVPKWVEDTDPNWRFPISDADDGLPEDGTKIVVLDLYQDVKENISTKRFLEDLRDTLQVQHQVELSSGTNISINTIPLVADPTIINSYSGLEPSIFRATYNRIDGDVETRIVVGIGPSVPEEAGWYVFCNGRMILRADRTEATGWGGKSGIRFPRYHNQYSRFRGFAFLNSENPELLPWNTTKDGLDLDSTLYSSVRQEMVQAARHVISFLNELDSELQQPLKSRTYTALARESDLRQIPATSVTKGPTAFKPSKRKVSAIRNVQVQYSKQRIHVEAAMEALGVSSATAVGQRTFEYYMARELDIHDA